MRSCGIVNLFTESRKVYEEVLDRAIDFEFRYSGARPLRDLKPIKVFGYYISVERRQTIDDCCSFNT